MKKNIWFEIVVAILILSITFFACSKTAGEQIPATNKQNETAEVGKYHNEILTYFIQFYNQNPERYAEADQITTYKNVIADYGSAVYAAYRKNPPANQSLDVWVGNLINHSFSNESKIAHKCIVENDMSIADALNYAFKKDVVPILIRNYCTDIEQLLNKGFSAMNYDLELKKLHLQYYKSASVAERPFVSDITDVASGSYIYWKKEAVTWNSAMASTNATKVKTVAKKLLKADISGVAEYYICRVLSVIGPLGWKAVAAIAAANSLVAGVDMLLDNWSANSMMLSRSVISQEELYDAYLTRKHELGLD